MSDSRKEESSGTKKRKFPTTSRKNLTRGGPAVLLTCETGREHKCKMQGLDILRHYLKSKDDEEEDTSLSLEDELQKLQSSTKKKNPVDFAVYNTGCRGSVFMMCSMESCQLIPTIQTAYRKEQEANSDDEPSQSSPEDANDEDKGQDTPETKKQKVEESNENLTSTGGKIQEANSTKESSEAPESPPPWDPIDMVRRVWSDHKKKYSNAPSSRFITRMIPVQATCYASVEELNLTTKALLEKFFPPEAKSFAVESKRRHCNSLSRDQIIETVAGQVLAISPDCKVKLDNPDVTIVVEICRTLCGVSVVENCAAFKKFNLAIVREGEM